MGSKSVVDLLAERLAARGVRRFFGVPGGDCSLDIIEAASRVGIDFILTRNETAAAIMASVTAELTGAPGVVMTTRGPGIANAVNGIAYAALDRAPLLVLADGYDRELDHVSHQRFDQAALLAPLTKGCGRLDGSDPGKDIDAIIDAAFALPPGPVYLEVKGADIRAEANGASAAQGPAAVHDPVAPAIPARVKSLLSAAKRPLVIAGLQACDAAAAAALRRLVVKWNCPVLMTYKSMGVVSSDDPRALGLYIGGVAEEPIITEADLILFYGLDAIEFPPHRWRYAAPIVELTAHAFDRNIVRPEVTLAGPLPRLAAAVEDLVDGSGWPPEFFGSARAHLRRRADASGGKPISPQQLVDAALAVAPKETRITVDAGAHMLPVLHSWHSSEPRQTLISRGLATMGFALPAAVASALAEPDRPVIAFTGDGGLMMCTAELGTAMQHDCRLVVVVFNDASLTLIGAKQRRRQLPNAGVDFAPADFASVARGFGCLGLRVETPGDLGPKMRQALNHRGPVLLDVVVDPAAYHEQIISLRG